MIQYFHKKISVYCLCLEDSVSFGRLDSKQSVVIYRGIKSTY